MDITVSIPNDKLAVVAQAFAANEGFVDPGGTVAQRKAAFTAYMVARWRAEATQVVRSYQISQAARTAILAEQAKADPLA